MTLKPETRKEIVAAYKRGVRVIEICKVFDIKPRMVYALIQQERETGAIMPKARVRGRKPKITREQIEQLRQLILLNPEITLKEMKETLNLPISISSISLLVNNFLGFSFQEKTIRKRTRMPGGN